MNSVAAWPSMAENWLDARGKTAWIAAVIVGFIVFWPLGLAILAYVTVGRRFLNGSPIVKAAPAAAYAFRTSGNQAFDSYKAETLRRLEDEQRAFESFLQRLREARDKAEFDQFMADQAKGHDAARPDGDDANPGDVQGRA